LVFGRSWTEGGLRFFVAARVDGGTGLDRAHDREVLRDLLEARARDVEHGVRRVARCGSHSPIVPSAFWS
jgi:hypothetical protein